MLKVTKIALAVLTVVLAGLFALTFVQKHFFTDSTPPVISFDSDVLEISVRTKQEELLSGVTAWDDSDGDLSSEVAVKSISKLIGKDTAKITYIVFDKADNMATATRTLRYTDYKKAEFRLSKPLVYEPGATVTLKDRLSAYDVIDGDLTIAIKVTATALNNTTEGTYPVTVQVTNSLGDTSALSLSVTIKRYGIYDPYIELTDYLVYIDEGSEFDPMDYIKSVWDMKQGGTEIFTWNDIAVETDLDTNAAGTYDVNYTYTNERGYAYSAILTVVVQ